MDNHVLERLGEGGFAAVPPDRLEDLAVWCVDWCEASGDARYCSLGETFRRLNDWWASHDEGGGVPTALVQEIDRIIRQDLPAILRERDAADAAPLARLFREEIQSQLLPVSAWIERGHARRAM